MKEIEYKVVFYQKEINESSETTEEEYEKLLNKYAKQGWKLIAVDDDKMYFEREEKS